MAGGLAVHAVVAADQRQSAGARRYVMTPATAFRRRHRRHERAYVSPLPTDPVSRAQSFDWRPETELVVGPPRKKSMPEPAFNIIPKRDLQ